MADQNAHDGVEPKALGVVRILVASHLSED
jgi:hypothetical protein